jgi:hypothetical protein
LAPDRRQPPPHITIQPSFTAGKVRNPREVAEVKAVTQAASAASTHIPDKVTTRAFRALLILKRRQNAKMQKNSLQSDEKEIWNSKKYIFLRKKCQK